MPAPVCVDELRKLYDAIMALQTGQRVTTISYGERSVTYGQHQVGQLVSLYARFYRQCGAGSGLINLAGERGAPITYRFT